MTEEVEDTKGKVLEEVEDMKANVLEELQTRLKDLYSELHLTKNALTNALSKLAAKDRQIDRSDKYNESLRTEIESLSLQIEGYRSAQTNRQDAQVQTNAEEILTAMAEKPFPAWNAELKQSEPATDAALSIEETLKATAEAALQQTGFVYDENTRLYYDYNSGYYYDGEQSLYYDPTCGTYFYYDEITGEYTFHSQIDAKTFRQYNHLIKKAQSEATREMGDRTDGKISDGSSTDIQTKTSLTSGTADRRDLVKKNKELDKNRKETDKRRKETDKRRKKPKDDEISNEDRAVAEVTADLKKLEVDSTLQNILAVAANWPPCIRAIVEQSDCLSVGTLFIVTCTSGSIGREKSMNHAITIPDINISKIHAELRFDYNRRCYVLTDKGSQNGTLLNWERVSQSEGESSGSSVKHGDIVQLGSTSLLLHIHQGMDTCDACEPGQVMAQFHKTNKPEIVVMSKKDRMRARREELKQIKMKYGLKNCAYVDNAAAIHNPAYADKSHIRRQTVGSDVPHGNTEAPASVYRPISEENKGHKLLAKMGWKEGQGLGRDNAGMSEPINIMLRGNQCAGLGSGAAVNTSLDNVDGVHRSKRWLQAQQRYDNLGKRDNSNNNKKSLPIQFSFEKSKTMESNVKQRPTVFPVPSEDDAAS